MVASLARKTRRAFVLIIFTPLLLGIIVAVELNAYQESVGWVAHTNLVLSTMDQVLLSVTRAESAQRGYLLTREKTYLNWFSKAEAESSVQLSGVVHLTADNIAQQHAVQLLQQAVEERFSLLHGLLQHAQPVPAKAAGSAPALSPGTFAMERIWDLTHSIKQRERDLLKQRLQGVRNAQYGVGFSFVVGIIVNLALLIWSYRLIQQYAQRRETAENQIRQLNVELEARVALRTSELEEVNLNLRRSNEDLSKFAYIASHDLQEPLRTIASYVELLQLRYAGKLDDKADKYIRFAVEGAKRMQQLVQDLLSYSRVGTEALCFETVDMNSTIETVRANLDLLFRERKVSLFTANLPTLEIDAGRLAQVFTNLVGNAIKFCKPDVAPHIVIESTRTGDEWLFVVVDNGIGFDQQYADRIFTIFQRLHSVGAYPGTGIGLAICRRIIEQHGGRIWATSTVGEGSRFYFTLPHKSRPSSPQSRSDAARCTIASEALSG